MLNLETELSRVSSAVIAGHIRPDGDCVGSCMGMYLYIKKNFPNSLDKGFCRGIMSTNSKLPSVMRRTRHQGHCTEWSEAENDPDE